MSNPGLQTTPGEDYKQSQKGYVDLYVKVLKDIYHIAHTSYTKY